MEYHGTYKTKIEFSSYEIAAAIGVITKELSLRMLRDVTKFKHNLLRGRIQVI